MDNHPQNHAIYIHTVACRPIAKYCLCKQQLLLGNGGKQQQQENEIFYAV
jgi:hypothetical protein